MRRGSAGARARAAALATLVVLAPAVPAAADSTGPGPAADDLSVGSTGPPPGPVGRATGPVLPRTEGPPPTPAPRSAAERAEADPLATLEAELAAAGDDYDGFLVVVADVGLFDHLRSLLTRGRLATPLERGADRIRAAGGVVEGELDGLVTAVVADLTVAEARALAIDPAVRWISPNARVSLDARRIATTWSQNLGNLLLWNLSVADSEAATWGASPYYGLLDQTYVHSSDGTGVTVFVMDTGIDAANVDVGGRVVPESEFPGGYYRIEDDPDDPTDAADTVEPDDDCNGHGTHVAGTVAGAVSGVARGARVVPVKVFPGCARSASYDDIIDGLNWIGAQVGTAPTRPYVVNMSLGGPPNALLEATVEALIGSEAAPRITVVAAAGNDAENASFASPARVPDVITVGAIGADVCVDQACSGTVFLYDEPAPYTNYGAVVDLMAPGSRTWSSCAATNLLTTLFDEQGDVIGYAQRACTAITIGGTTYQLTPLNGTSMAAPFVAGLAARYLGERFAADGTVATPAEVRAALVDGALADVVDGDFVPLNGSPNLVANTRFLEPVPSAPVLPVVTACTGGAAASDLLQLPAVGVGPFTWTITAGSLPDGLTLSADGRLTGSTTPAAHAGTVTLRIEDPFGRTSSATFSRSAFPAGCPD